MMLIAPDASVLVCYNWLFYINSQSHNRSLQLWPTVSLKTGVLAGFAVSYLIEMLFLCFRHIFFFTFFSIGKEIAKSIEFDFLRV